MSTDITAKKKAQRLTPAEQSARFIEAAKKADADERLDEFEKVIKWVVRKKSIPKK